MNHFIFLIINILPLCFCQEQRNQNVETPCRIAREDEKSDEQIQNVLKGNNRVQLSLQPKIKLPFSFLTNNKERPSKKSKSDLSSSSDGVNQVSSSNQVVQSQPKNVQKIKEVIRSPKPDLNIYKTAKQNVPEFEKKEQINHEVNNIKNNDLRNKITQESIFLIEDPAEDLKIIIKPQVTTQSLKAHTQIDNPLDKHRDENSMLSESSQDIKQKTKIQFRKKSKIATPSVDSNDDTRFNMKRNFNESELSPIEIPANPNPSRVLNEIQTQLAFPELHANPEIYPEIQNVETDILELEKLIAAKRKRIKTNFIKNAKVKENADIARKEIPILDRGVMKIDSLPNFPKVSHTPESDISLKSKDTTVSQSNEKDTDSTFKMEYGPHFAKPLKEMPILNRRVIKIDSLPIFSKVDNTPVSDVSLNNKESTMSQSREKITDDTFNTDDIFRFVKPLLNSATNRIVEEQQSSSVPEEKFILQEYETQTSQDNYYQDIRFDVTLVPPSNGYSNLNQNYYNMFYQAYPKYAYNNFQQKFADPSQKLYRFRVSTEVVVKINNPYYKKLHSPMIDHMSQRNIHYNNVARDTIRSNRYYPYVIPSIGYGSSNRYYPTVPH